MGTKSFHFWETQFGEKNGLIAAVEKLGNPAVGPEYAKYVQKLQMWKFRNTTTLLSCTVIYWISRNTMRTYHDVFSSLNIVKYNKIYLINFQILIT